MDKNGWNVGDAKQQPSVSLADRFEEERSPFEANRLPVSRRQTRRDEFVKVLDEPADGHKRSK